MNRSDRQRGEGFTLIEALLAAAVLALAIGAVIMPFTVGMRSQAVEARQTLAVSLAEELMEEVLAKPFEEPGDGDEDPEPVSAFGPDAGEASRESFSAIDDYAGYTEAAGAIMGPDGAVVNDAAARGLSRHVTVTYVYVPGQDAAEDPSFFRVTVEVRYEGTPLLTLTRLIHWLN